jgi:7,8-dihydropterin-6-yl-methyl-4-(beta-D-ribofuranosyl)aminobenzene 5'-phosphate synthase
LQRRKQDFVSAKLTVACDDFSGAEPGFCTSYGFSLLIQAQGTVVLFDAGTHPQHLMANLHACGRTARDLNAVILSHNHFDHTDGLPGLLEENPELPVYVHEDWDRPHSFKGFVVPRANRVQVRNGTELAELGPGLLLTRSHFSTDYGGIYEHACCIQTESALILVTGCCHPGLDAFLDDLDRSAVGAEQPLYIIGGLHGFRFSAARARAVDRRLRRVICCHCTTEYDTFQSQFGDRCQRLPVGATLEVP